jgi:N-acetylglucosaminylphosphatidylinositol deacetylase
MFTMVLYYIALSALGFLVFWFLTSVLFTSSFPPPDELRNKGIVLLIGHPDDEAMFFGPSLTALTSPQNGNEVKIICLSTGNAIGEGEIRRGELLDSARRLGIPRAEDVYIVDDPRFQDSPTSDWKKEDIADFLAQSFAPQPASKSTSTSTSTSTPNLRLNHCQPQQPHHTKKISPTSTPDVIITFDTHGISTHPNHCACYHGALHFLSHSRWNSKSLPAQPSLALYTLTTTPFLRKYISVLDAPLTLFTIVTSILLSRLKSTPHKRRSKNTHRGDRVVFVSGFKDYARAFGAMVFAHKTQMLWFRWGWIIAGRYMVVNDLKRERIPA